MISRWKVNGASLLCNENKSELPSKFAACYWLPRHEFWTARVFDKIRTFRFCPCFFYWSLNLLTHIICTTTVFLFWSSGHGQQQVVPSPVSATSPPTSKPQPQNGSSGMGKTRHARLRADYKCQAFEQCFEIQSGTKGNVQNAIRDKE